MPRNRGKQKGRSETQPFQRLYRFMVQSAEFNALSAPAVKLLVDFGARYNGANNGDLSAAWSDLSQRGWASENTMRRALQELLEARFLICTRAPLRKRCGLYALAWEPIDECPGKFLEVRPTRKAGHEWRDRSSNGGCKPTPEQLPGTAYAATTDANRRGIA